MRRNAQSLVPAGLLILAGCAAVPKPEPEKHYQQVPVAVSAPCVDQRPPEVVPLKDAIPEAEWYARAPGAKAATVEAQAGERMNYQDRLEAATSGCRDVR